MPLERMSAQENRMKTPLSATRDMDCGWFGFGVGWFWLVWAMFWLFFVGFGWLVLVFVGFG